MKKLWNEYNITEQDIHIVVAAYEALYKEHGVAFEYVDNTSLKEYADQSDFETATSNGVRVRFEKDYVKAGGIEVRLYDMYHLIGHYSQWNYTKEGALDFQGDKGWGVGTIDFSRPENDTESAMAYEKEAGQIGVFFMDKMLKLVDMSEEKKVAIKQYVSDFQAADIEVLRAFYNDGDEVLHESVWVVGTTPLESIAIDSVMLEPKLRETENLAIVPVLHFQEKKASFLDRVIAERSNVKMER